MIEIFQDSSKINHSLCSIIVQFYHCWYIYYLFLLDERSIESMECWTFVVTRSSETKLRLFIGHNSQMMDLLIMIVTKKIRSTVGHVHVTISIPRNGGWGEGGRLIIELTVCLYKELVTPPPPPLGGLRPLHTTDNPFSTGTGWTLYKAYGSFRISYGTG